MSTPTLAERLMLAIKATTQEHRRYKELEEITGIPADRWKAFALGRQRPTAEMIEGVCQAWPYLALWITTGITDSANGQIGVSAAYANEINLAVKPDPMACVQYLKRKVEIYRLMHGEGRDALTKEELDEIYQLRCTRDNDRLGFLKRNSLTKSGEILGYFDPRLMRHSNLNDDDGAMDFEVNQEK